MFSKPIILIIVLILLLLFYVVIRLGAGKKKDIEDSRSLTRYLFGVRILIAILAYFTSYNKVTSRWLILFGKPIFQTSELIKIGIIIFTASFIANNKRKISDFNFMIKNYYPYLALSVSVVLFQPDLSSSVMILGISLSMIFIAGMDKKQIRFLLES